MKGVELASIGAGAALLALGVRRRRIPAAAVPQARTEPARPGMPVGWVPELYRVHPARLQFRSGAIHVLHID